MCVEHDIALVIAIVSSCLINSLVPDVDGMSLIVIFLVPPPFIILVISLLFKGEEGGYDGTHGIDISGSPASITPFAIESDCPIPNTPIS